MDTLQLVLILGFVVMAIINAASLLWAFYLDRRLRGRPVPKHYDVHVEGTKVFPAADLQMVEAKAQELLGTVVSEAAGKLQVSLDTMVKTTTEHLQKTTTKDLDGFHANLEKLNQQSVASFQKLESDIATRRETLLKQLQTEVVAERTRQMDAFNSKLNDIVASYLIESLGSQVDLGAEAPYIFEVLNMHKDDIKRDVLS